MWKAGVIIPFSPHCVWVSRVLYLPLRLVDLGQSPSPERQPYSRLYTSSRLIHTHARTKSQEQQQQLITDVVRSGQTEEKNVVCFYTTGGVQKNIFLNLFLKMARVIFFFFRLPVSVGGKGGSTTPSLSSNLTRRYSSLFSCDSCIGFWSDSFFPAKWFPRNLSGPFFLFCPL